MSSQIFLDMLNGKSPQPSYQGAEMTAGSGYQMTEAEKIAFIKKTAVDNPQAAQEWAEYMAVKTKIIPNEYGLMSGSGGITFLAGEELNSEVPDYLLNSANMGGTIFTSAGYVCSFIPHPVAQGMSILFFGVGTGLDALAATGHLANAIENPNIQNTVQFGVSLVNLGADFLSIKIGNTPNVTIQPKLYYNNPKFQEIRFNQLIKPAIPIGIGWGSYLGGLSSGTNNNH